MIISLYKEVQTLKPYVEQSSRIANVPIVHEDGKLSAYNTLRYGEIYLNNDQSNWAVSGTDLIAVLTPESKVYLENNALIVKHKRAKFKLPLIAPGTYMEPAPINSYNINELIVLTAEDIDMIKRAAMFASSNAMHAWAASVTFFCGRVIATNNIALISWKVPSWSEHTFVEPLTMPIWGIDILCSNILIGAIQNQIVFVTHNDERGYICPLEESPPQMMLDFGRKILGAYTDLHWCSTRPYKAAFEELAVLNSLRFVIDRDKITTEYRPGAIGEAMVDAAFPDIDTPPFQAFIIGREIAQLIFDNAMFLSFDQVPDRLYFSTTANAVGMCACMSVVGNARKEL